jgi:hypothetical protein
MATNTRGQQPARQSPAHTYNGRPAAGTDPTNQPGQLPSEIFGFSQTYSTGAGGSGGRPEASHDVTTERGQLDPGLANVEGSEITSTGAPGSQGARNSGGGETVSFTDPFAFPGGNGGEMTTRGQVGGENDWTTFGESSGFSGPTLPVLQNARPTSTGAGQGHVRGAGKGL